MRVLFTGASSPLGGRVLAQLLRFEEYTEVWATIHRRPPAVTDPKLRVIRLDLENDQVDLGEIPAPLDLVIHFAAVTHAQDGSAYAKINFHGTMQLARAARALGCRQFIYISTRCATEGSGAYGESKLAAERGLLALEWERLLILRPAEIYGSLGGEGIDKLLALAARFHLVPLFWGHDRLRFAPLTTEDFVEAVTTLIRAHQRGVQIFEVCGPEDLSGSEVALRIAARYRALPVPIWWPLLRGGLRILHALGIRIIAPDQLERLVGRKTANQSTPDPALAHIRSRFLRP